MLKPIITYSCIGIAAIVAIGCLTPSSAVQKQVGQTIESTRQFAAVPLQERLGQLILGGMAMNVAVKTEFEKPSSYTYLISKHGKLVERESYQVKGDTVHLLEAAGETYQPPMVILKAPVTPNSTWTWEGTMSTKDRVRPASATISVRPEKLNLESGNFDSLRSTVDLKLDATSEFSVERRLSFWFVEGEGVIKRDFNGVSTRLPSTNP